MISLGDARRYVDGLVAPLDVVTVPVADAIGLVLAEPVAATELVPPFANSAMDGFAVRAADTAPGAELRLVATIAAGAPWDGEVGAGETARIMTGAPMPAGADAVVMVERARVDGDIVDGATVVLEVAVDVGNHVRPAGDDMVPGDEVLPAWAEVTPAVVGVLHTLGRTEVSVVRRPRVGVFSTGDELVGAGDPVGPGQIRDSNRPTLLAMVAATGAIAVDLGLVRDDEAAIEAALREAAATCDAVVTSGGVSMGDFDFVKAVLDRIGDMRWMQVEIRPAKPLAAGTVDAGAKRVPVLGLPGNPVSSIVSFELFARPAIRALMGHGRRGAHALDRPRLAARTQGDLRRRPDGKVHFARVVVEADDSPIGGLVARSAGGQGSHHTAAMAAANALAILPDGDGVADGEVVRFMFLD